MNFYFTIKNVYTYTHIVLFPCTYYSSRFFGNTDSLKFLSQPSKLCFIVEETEAQRGKGTCPKLCHKSWDLNLGGLALKTVWSFISSSNIWWKFSNMKKHWKNCMWIGHPPTHLGYTRTILLWWMKLNNHR